MKKRVLAAFLWFYAGWYAGALVADFLGVSAVLGPILGAAAAAIVVGDPRGLIWKRRSAATTSTSAERVAPAEIAPDPA
jgi:hypothetical protein